jgi:hypothetical protein
VTALSPNYFGVTMDSTMISVFRSNPYVAVRVEAPIASLSSLSSLSSSASLESPLHVGFLLDVSYSMSGERLAAVKRTLEAVLPLFRDTDFCTIATFSSSAKTVISKVVMDAAGKDTFLTQTRDMITDGNTDLGLGITHLSSLHRDYSAVIILTDGEITAGVASNDGIRALLGGFGSCPIHTLGYGAEHNRRLLNSIAINSCATYTFVDAETTLPLSMSDLLEGLRTEVLHNAVVSLASSSLWKSIELNAEGATDHRLGGIVPGRSYWSIFMATDPIGAGDLVGRVTLRAQEGEFTCDSTCDSVDSTELGAVQEQIMRARVASLLLICTTELERPRSGRGGRDALNASIQVLLDDIGDSVLPLMLRMKGQLIDMRGHLQNMRSRHDPEFGLTFADGHTTSSRDLARFTSVTGVLSCQRGVTRYTSDQDPDQTFSSPGQRNASQNVSAVYSQVDPE